MPVPQSTRSAGDARRQTGCIMRTGQLLIPAQVAAGGLPRLGVTSGLSYATSFRRRVKLSPARVPCALTMHQRQCAWRNGAGTRPTRHVFPQSLSLETGGRKPISSRPLFEHIKAARARSPLPQRVTRTGAATCRPPRTLVRAGAVGVLPGIAAHGIEGRGSRLYHAGATEGTPDTYPPRPQWFENPTCRAPDGPEHVSRRLKRP